MDERLYHASLEGNITSLMELLNEDPLVLERTIFTTSNSSSFSHQNNPLHIAAMRGHVDFAREILNRETDLASELDSEGFSPLHLASARKNVGMVRELVGAAPDVCLVTDNEGRTPLHVATMKGRVEIMKELFRCRPEAIDQPLFNRGETILHLCVNHSRLEALQLVLQWVLNRSDDPQASNDSCVITVNSKDNNGNTILHLAVAKKQIQIIKLLLSINDNSDHHQIEVNALNRNGLTALDISLQSSVVRDVDFEIRELLQGAGGTSTTAQVEANINNNNIDNINAANTHVLEVSMDDPKTTTLRNSRSSSSSSSSFGSGSEAAVVARGDSTNSSSWRKQLDEHEKWLAKKQNTLMVVASLIATMAFQALQNPPSVLSPSIPTHPGSSMLFMYCNTIGFLGSMSVIILMVSGLPLDRRIFIWVLMFIIWAASTSLGLSYIQALAAMALNGWLGTTEISALWIRFAFFIFLVHITRFILQLLRNKGRKKRVFFLIFWSFIAGASLVIVPELFYITLLFD